MEGSLLLTHFLGLANLTSGATAGTQEARQEAVLTAGAAAVDIQIVAEDTQGYA